MLLQEYTKVVMVFFVAKRIQKESNRFVIPAAAFVGIRFVDYQTFPDNLTLW